MGVLIVSSTASHLSRWPDLPLDLERVVRLFSSEGCQQLWVKQLAQNDDSKRQIYLSSDLLAFNILHPRNVALAPPARKGLVGTKKPVKAGAQRLFGTLDFKWLFLDHSPEPARHAKLIYYPQYPEVRFSGFCLGVKSIPTVYLKEKAGEIFTNRLLFLGVAPKNQTFGFLTVGHDLLTDELRKADGENPKRALIAISIANADFDSKQRLLKGLHRIYRRGWIRGCRLTAEGLKENDAPNAIGYTLEAQLGIPNNGQNLPDFEGFEIKATAAGTDGKPLEKAITLMTPEPDLGVYKTKGALEFLKRWGYPHDSDPLNRVNFGGIYRFGHYHPVTGLKLDIRGYHSLHPNLIDPTGCVMLIDADGTVAAGWSFSKLLQVWSRKHTRAAYVSAETRGSPRKFRYAAHVTLCEGTDLLKVLKMLSSGDLYLDPGIKAEKWRSSSPVLKKRNQFRTKPSQLKNLYEHTQDWDAENEGSSS
jgi:hypothetical protein